MSSNIRKAPPPPPPYQRLQAALRQVVRLGQAPSNLEALRRPMIQALDPAFGLRPSRAPRDAELLWPLRQVSLSLFAHVDRYHRRRLSWETRPMVVVFWCALKSWPVPSYVLEYLDTLWVDCVDVSSWSYRLPDYPHALALLVPHSAQVLIRRALPRDVDATEIFFPKHLH